MNRKLLGTAFIAATTTAFTSGCGILETLETVEVPRIRLDSNSYVVQPGDTLNSVASRYKIDPDSLLTVNSLELAELIPGQRLVLIRDDEVLAAAATRTEGVTTGGVATPDSSLIMGNPQVSGAGESVPLPNTTQVVRARTPDAGVIGSDVVIPPQDEEEIVAVVNVNDDLLDDQPIFVPDGELDASAEAAQQVVRPQGVETIVQTVTINGPTNQPPAPLDIPSAATVDITDADTSAPARRITVKQSGNTGWSWPVLGTITKGFDLREINRQGLDIDPGPGAAVQAAADGEVVYSGRDLASYGNLVILRHEGNYLSAYSKVSEIFVKENQKVKAGDLIASVGKNDAGSHEMHFEIRRNGEPVNPIDYLPAL